MLISQTSAERIILSIYKGEGQWLCNISNPRTTRFTHIYQGPYRFVLLVEQSLLNALPDKTANNPSNCYFLNDLSTEHRQPFLKL